MMDRNKKILICKHRALGDSIMGMSAISFAKKLFPNSKIYYGVPSWVAPLYENINHDADQIFSLNLTNAKEILKTFFKLKRESFNLIFELHQSGKTNKVFSLLSFLNKNLTYYYHNHHLKKGTEIKDQGVPKELIQRDLDGMASLLDPKGPWPHYLKYTPTFKPKNAVSKKKRILLGIVATRKAKMWPLEFFAELSKNLLELDPEIEIGIALSKSLEDLALQKKMQSLISHERLVFHLEPLDKLPELFFGSSLYIGNDTGQKHLAVACGLKTVTFFGPEPPKEWHPYSSKEHIVFYKEGLACRTKSSHFCGLSECDSMICLNEFYPNAVFTKVKKLILEDSLLSPI